jgi:excisionase family DNA binding protein
MEVLNNLGHFDFSIAFTAITASPKASGWHIYQGGLMDTRTNVPIWEKTNLTLTEAAEYYNIGVNKLREMTNSEDCPYVLWVGNKRLIKRQQFNKYLDKVYSI